MGEFTRPIQAKLTAHAREVLRVRETLGLTPGPDRPDPRFDEIRDLIYRERPLAAYVLGLQSVMGRDYVRHLLDIDLEDARDISTAALTGCGRWAWNLAIDTGRPDAIRLVQRLAPIEVSPFRGDGVVAQASSFGSPISFFRGVSDLSDVSNGSQFQRLSVLEDNLGTLHHASDTTLGARAHLRLWVFDDALGRLLRIVWRDHLVEWLGHGAVRSETRREGDPFYTDLVFTDRGDGLPFAATASGYPKTHSPWGHRPG